MTCNMVSHTTINRTFLNYVSVDQCMLPKLFMISNVDCMIDQKQLLLHCTLICCYVWFFFPFQVIGSITGVKLIIQIFPGIGSGPRLNVDIHQGALTEGFLTFAIVIISLGLTTKIPSSFFIKTWIASISKLALHILGSDLTGGCMNPASVSTHRFLVPINVVDNRT